MNQSMVKATLSFSDDSPSVEMPIYKGTMGPDVIDIRKLYGQTGKFTYDPGFMSTAACNSAITYIDGDKGELLYRGFPIEELAVNADFLESCYLLLKGELPTVAQKTEFVDLVTRHTMVHEQMHFFFRGFRRDAHPMAVLVAAVGALSAFYHDSLNINDPRHREVSAIRMIAKLPTLVAMAYKYSIGQPFVYPKNDLSYSANFMHMMFSNPCEEYKVNDVLVRALDRILILHADHEQNASTSTVRLAGSSGANPFACIAAGIACLWGPAHGGANEAALNMLEEIGSVDNIPEFIKQVKDKNSGAQPSGHRLQHVDRRRLMRDPLTIRVVAFGQFGGAVSQLPQRSSRRQWRSPPARRTTGPIQSRIDRIRRDRNGPDRARRSPDPRATAARPRKARAPRPRPCWMRPWSACASGRWTRWPVSTTRPGNVSRPGGRGKTARSRASASGAKPRRMR